MLSAALIVAEANQIAKGRGFATQGLDMLNAILGDLCQDYDLALARGQFNFNFNPQLVSLFGSGPYPMPVDYLRTSGSSGARGTNTSAWYLYPAPTLPAGQPIVMEPIDLAEFDQFAKLPSQSTPELWCTDMGGPLTQRIVLSTTAGLTINSTGATVASAAGLIDGIGMAGEGIQAGTTVTNVAGLNITLSLPAKATLANASVFFGIAPVGYAYPAPLGTYPVTIRYQRQMPPIVDGAQIPWFPSEGYLIDELASRMMAFTGDSRIDSFHARGMSRLSSYIGLVDDLKNRSQQVQLDSRNFKRRGGLGGRNLPMTKTMGWP